MINYSSLTVLCDSMYELLLFGFIANYVDNKMSSVYIQIGKEDTAKWNMLIWYKFKALKKRLRTYEYVVTSYSGCLDGINLKFMINW